MRCKKCAAEIPSENVNIQLAVARCDGCNTVFSFQEDAPAADTIRESGPPQILGLGLPKGLTLERTEKELRLRRRWFSPLTVILTAFAIFWDGFLLVWFVVALSDGAPVMAAAGSLHALIGCGITYYVLAGYLNTTLIAVNKDHLNISYAPLPWLGAKTLPAGKILQLYCKSVHGGSRRRTTPAASYELRAAMTDSEDVKLLSGLVEDFQVLFLEREIEKYLGIKDRPAGRSWKN